MLAGHCSYNAPMHTWMFKCPRGFQLFERKWQKGISSNGFFSFCIKGMYCLIFYCVFDDEPFWFFAAFLLIQRKLEKKMVWNLRKCLFRYLYILYDISLHACNALKFTWLISKIRLRVFVYDPIMYFDDIVSTRLLWYIWHSS